MVFVRICQPTWQAFPKATMLTRLGMKLMNIMDQALFFCVELRFWFPKRALCVKGLSSYSKNVRDVLRAPGQFLYERRMIFEDSQSIG